MFEEIKDYQGRDLNTTELISLYSKILSLFPEKERNIGGHDVILS